MRIAPRQNWIIALYWGAMGIVILSVYELEEVRMAWKFRKREKAQRK